MTHQQSMLDERKTSPRPFRFHAEPVFQRVLEEFERRQIARAQAHAFEIEQLDEGDQHQQRDGEQGRQDRRPASWPHPLDQSGGRPRRVRQRFSARAICAAVGLVIEAEKVQHAVQHQDLDFLFDAYGRIRRAWARARPSEMARSPRCDGRRRQRETKARRWGNRGRGTGDSGAAGRHRRSPGNRRDGPGRLLFAAGGRSARTARGGNRVACGGKVTVLPSGEDMRALKLAERLRRPRHFRLAQFQGELA